jgi:hypothetical protein
MLRAKPSMPSLMLARRTLRAAPASEFAVSGQQGRAKAVRVLFTVFDEHDGSPLPGLGRRPEPCCTPCAAVGSMIC